MPTEHPPIEPTRAPTSDPQIGRRALLFAGLGVAAAAATGCTSGRPTRTSRLPSPVWPHQRRTAAQAAGAAASPPAAAPAPSLGRVAIVPRARWTNAATKLWDTDPMAGIDRITVHHDGMEPVPITSAAQAADRLETIRRAHVDSRGWADIGYHFAIDPQGRIWAARPLDRQGAHVRDQNEHNMGILVLGNFDRQSPTPQALNALDSLIVEAAQANRVSLQRIRTHQEWNATACPGASLQAHMMWSRSARGRVSRSLNRA